MAKDKDTQKKEVKVEEQPKEVKVQEETKDIPPHAFYRG